MGFREKEEADQKRDHQGHREPQDSQCQPCYTVQAASLSGSSSFITWKGSGLGLGWRVVDETAANLVTHRGHRGDRSDDRILPFGFLGLLNLCTVLQCVEQT